VTEFRYKAFISYSHSDEAWARWLHGALESYRLPRKLARTDGRFGPIPARLFPVFRDRDELSSAIDLSEKVQEALAESAALVVICSPAAAASRWVNEEIRAFRALGRGDRIFSLIVDGDPKASGLDESCFPPALLEGGVGESQEPLAADARKWADGKPLARLKLIAGILGIRLDELRRREQKRRTRTRIIAIAAGLAALGLITVALLSKQQEQARRAHSEALVSQIVAFSEDLNSVANLEMLRSMGERLQGYLDTLDPRDLTPESQKQIGLVLRQLGEVSRLQGRPDEALQALRESREVFRRLARQAPDNTNYLYELGNAEYYVANALMDQGSHELAGQAFDRYAGLARELYQRDPENPDWIMELSSSHANLAAFQILSETGNVASALEHAYSAIHLVESAIERAPADMAYQQHYATILAWTADTYLRICDVHAALEKREQGERLARSNLAGNSSNNNLKKQHAYALTGVAALQKQAGATELALQNLRLAREILKGLTAFDDQNLDYAWQTLWRDALIFDLLSDTGDLDTAFDMAPGIEQPMREILGKEPLLHAVRYSQFAQYLLDYSALLWRVGEVPAAQGKLEQALAALESILTENPGDTVSRERLRWPGFCGGSKMVRTCWM
jgi:tetratricopeptide (TPR) repeat protein